MDTLGLVIVTIAVTGVLAITVWFVAHLVRLGIQHGDWRDIEREVDDRHGRLISIARHHTKPLGSRVYVVNYTNQLGAEDRAYVSFVDENTLGFFSMHQHVVAGDYKIEWSDAPPEHG